MKKEVKFYRCKHCGNIIYIVNDSGAPIVCCGEKMEFLSANSKEAVVEKHIPFVEEKDNQIYVKVGSVEHPMTEEHYIQWIVVVQNGNVQFQHLTPQDKPEANFFINLDDNYTVYEYCNLHGLWEYNK